MESKIVQKNIELASMNREELTSLISELREPAFRVKQISEWLSRGVKPMDMLNIPKALREMLAKLPFGSAEII